MIIHDIVPVRRTRKTPSTMLSKWTAVNTVDHLPALDEIQWHVEFDDKSVRKATRRYQADASIHR